MFKRTCLLSGTSFLFAFYASTGAASSFEKHYINIEKHMFEVPAVTVKEAEECFVAVFRTRNSSPESDEGVVVDNVKSGRVMANVWYKKYVLAFFAEDGSESDPKTPTQIFRGSVDKPNFEQLLLTAKTCNDQVRVVF